MFHARLIFAAFVELILYRTHCPDKVAATVMGNMQGIPFLVEAIGKIVPGGVPELRFSAQKTNDCVSLCFNASYRRT